MKHNAPQFALDLGPAEPFKLVQESAPDADRLAHQLDQADRDRQTAEQLQPDLLDS